MAHSTRFRQRSFVATSDDIWVRFQPATHIVVCRILALSRSRSTDRILSCLNIHHMYYNIIHNVNCFYHTFSLIRRSTDSEQPLIFTCTSRQKVFHPHQALSLCSLHRFDRKFKSQNGSPKQRLCQAVNPSPFPIPKSPKSARAALRAWRPMASKPPQRRCRAASTACVDACCGWMCYIAVW